VFLGTKEKKEGGGGGAGSYFPGGLFGNALNFFPRVFELRCPWGNVM
jgi:hypothetical protein